MKLNEEQTLAVEHKLNWPCALIAGAGSGKTRVLTERVRWLIQQGVSPRKICVITFTNRAAGELKERLNITDETPRDKTPWVSTIHSLALQMIRRDPRSFGYSSEKITPLDDYDQNQMMKKIVEREEGEENPYKILEQIQYHSARGVGFSSDYTPEVHEEALKSHKGYHAMEGDSIHYWKLYEKEKLANSVVDFSDMLHFPVRRMKNDPKFSASCQRLFEHVLMDEVQDTNVVQWTFVNGLLGSENKNLTVVGDLSQSIYGFNGAAPELLMEYSQNWRGVTPSLYKIARNHRSVPQVVSLANAIQKKMTEAIPLKMESWRGLQGEKGTTKILKAKASFGPSPDGIAGCIADEILASERRGVPYKENAILVRSGIQIRDIEAELVRARIPYIIRGGRGLLQTEEVRDVLAYLRLATNVLDFMALSRAVQVPRRGVGEVALENIRKLANEKHGGNLLIACTSHAKLAPFSELIEGIRQQAGNPIEALKAAIKASKYAAYLGEKYKKDQKKLQTKLENLQSLQAMFEDLASEREMTTEDIVFQLTMERPTDGDPNGSVVISTIHASKGLEWKQVFVTNVVEGSIPHMWSSDTEEDLAEERRLLYVAITRARDSLTICVQGMNRTFVKDGPPRIHPVTPSRFLFELGIVS
jgi:DNA helicase II / ATP-dependent DNA helicase PcrA